MVITSENDILDVNSVNAACKLIRDGAAYYTRASSKITDASLHCGSNALAVDGKNMVEEFSSISKQFNDLRDNIDNFCTSVEKAAEQIAKSQRQQLQEYQESQKQNN